MVAMVEMLTMVTNGLQKTTLQMRLALFTRLEDGIMVLAAVLCLSAETVNLVKLVISQRSTTSTKSMNMVMLKVKKT